MKKPLLYFNGKNSDRRILDSGDRTEFASGAVRDMREGKGRCDLMPMSVMAELFDDGVFFRAIEGFQGSGDPTYLYYALRGFAGERWSKDDGLTKTEEELEKVMQMEIAEMCLEVAKHFEEGAKKYGENNWQKGIPVKCYIDSAVRHYLKHIAGWTDEPHDRAICWNLMCAIWTCYNYPDLNEYPLKRGTDEKSSARA